MEQRHFTSLTQFTKTVTKLQTSLKIGPKGTK